MMAGEGVDFDLLSSALKSAGLFAMKDIYKEGLEVHGMKWNKIYQRVFTLTLDHRCDCKVHQCSGQNTKSRSRMLWIVQRLPLKL